jgi:hypothetical protein
MRHFGRKDSESAAGAAELPNMIKGVARAGKPYDEINAFISRTARSMPTMMARDTMLWPMFNSCIDAIPATAFTF